MVNFETDVIQRSHAVPVVVDFWAAWCGPCRVLGPVIEQLAQEANGRWELVKVDTEAQQDIARRYQIMSIPAVKMFVQGEVVADFAGALPRPQIQKWLDQHLPDPRKDQLAEIRLRLGGPDTAQALETLHQLVAQHPDYDEARVLHAGFQVPKDPITAQDQVSDIKIGSPYEAQAEGVNALAEMMLVSEDGHPKVAQLIEQAREAFRQYDLEQTIELLIQAVMIDKAYCHELPRRAALGLFHLLGPAHPLTKQQRPYFDMALY
jgi:putative thioredoxin